MNGARRRAVTPLEQALIVWHRASFAEVPFVAPSKMLTRGFIFAFASLTLACGARSGLPLPEQEDSAAGGPFSDVGVDGAAFVDVSTEASTVDASTMDTFVDEGPHTAVVPPDPGLPRCEDRPITCVEGDATRARETLHLQLDGCAPGKCGQATYRFDGAGCVVSVETIGLTQSEANCLVQPALVPKKRFLCLKGTAVLVTQCVE